MFKVNNENTLLMNFEHISQLFLMILLLTLNKQLLTGLKMLTFRGSIITTTQCKFGQASQPFLDKSIRTGFKRDKEVTVCQSIFVLRGKPLN